MTFEGARNSVRSRGCEVEALVQQYFISWNRHHILCCTQMHVVEIDTVIGPRAQKTSITLQQDHFRLQLFLDDLLEYFPPLFGIPKAAH